MIIWVVIDGTKHGCQIQSCHGSWPGLLLPFWGSSWGGCSVVNCSVINAPSCQNHSFLNNDTKNESFAAPTTHKIIPTAHKALHAPGFCSIINRGWEPGRVSPAPGCSRTFSRAAQDVSILAHFSQSACFQSQLGLQCSSSYISPNRLLVR